MNHAGRQLACTSIALLALVARPLSASPLRPDLQAQARELTAFEVTLVQRSPRNPLSFHSNSGPLRGEWWTAENVTLFTLIRHAYGPLMQEL